LSAIRRPTQPPDLPRLAGLGNQPLPHRQRGERAGLELLARVGSDEDRPYRHHSERELFYLIRDWENYKRQKEREKSRFEKENMKPSPQGYDWIWTSPDYLRFEEIIGNMGDNIRAAQAELAARRVARSERAARSGSADTSGRLPAGAKRGVVKRWNPERGIDSLLSKANRMSSFTSARYN
jgi:hypothetical protein